MHWLMWVTKAKRSEKQLDVYLWYILPINLWNGERLVWFKGIVNDFWGFESFRNCSNAGPICCIPLIHRNGILGEFSKNPCTLFFGVKGSFHSNRFLHFLYFSCSVSNALWPRYSVPIKMEKYSTLSASSPAAKSKWSVVISPSCPTFLYTIDQLRADRWSSILLPAQD